MAKNPLRKLGCLMILCVFLQKNFTNNSMMAPLPNKKRITVVGAGLAGLTLAYRLTQAGHPVDVYEARQRVGGRVFSVQIGNTIGELGGHNINDGGDAPHLTALAKELGLDIAEKKLFVSQYQFTSYFDNMKLLISKKRLTTFN